MPLVLHSKEKIEFWFGREHLSFMTCQKRSNWTFCCFGGFICAPNLFEYLALLFYLDHTLRQKRCRIQIVFKLLGSCLRGGCWCRSRKILLNLARFRNTLFALWYRTLLVTICGPRPWSCRFTSCSSRPLTCTSMPFSAVWRLAGRRGNLSQTYITLGCLGFSLWISLGNPWATFVIFWSSIIGRTIIGC